MILNNNTNQPEIYQIRVVLKDVSPIIWRRILVKDSTSIADLHHILQVILEWDDDHLNQFTIHGKQYGVYHSGGVSFRDDPETVYLKDFQFRLNEKFKYEYNFNDEWEFELRFEKAVPANPKINYPYCLSGGRSAPPEDCGGVVAFLELDQHYSIIQIYEELVQLIKRHKKDQEIENKEEPDAEDEEESDDDDDFEPYDYDVDNFEEGIETLRYWHDRNKFNRRKINNLLKAEFNTDKEGIRHAS